LNEGRPDDPVGLRSGEDGEDNARRDRRMNTDADQTEGLARIGCSGFDYPEWNGAFYPSEADTKQRFAHYAKHFRTVEINRTFYSLPTRDTFDGWRSQAPSGFLYTLKLSRYATHIKRLKDPDGWVANFTERANRLGPTLGPILIQLPPRWKPEIRRLADALDAFPPNFKMALEVRDPRWLVDDVFRTLADRNAALVAHDLIANHPEPITADFVFFRYHGTSQDRKYAGHYSHQKLSAAARRIAQHIRGGRQVFTYFNNDANAEAPQDARRLKRFVHNSFG
jgi:uncharacterized protein YecE (DUF72 family)